MGVLPRCHRTNLSCLVKESELDLLTPMAVNDPSTGGNRRPAGDAEMHRMFTKAIRGDLT
ncbi:MAG: hypothetical protein ABI648_14985 [Betaproteobacteria bacterium]